MYELKRPIYNLHPIHDHILYHNTLQSIALRVPGVVNSVNVLQECINQMKQHEQYSLVFGGVHLVNVMQKCIIPMTNNIVWS